jgi:hypothetical protein
MESLLTIYKLIYGSTTSEIYLNHTIPLTIIFFISFDSMTVGVTATSTSSFFLTFLVGNGSALSSFFALAFLFVS